MLDSVVSSATKNLLNGLITWHVVLLGQLVKSAKLEDAEPNICGSSTPLLSIATPPKTPPFHPLAAVAE